MTPHSNILAWRIPWTEEPGGLLSIEFQRLKRLSTVQPSTQLSWKCLIEIDLWVLFLLALKGETLARGIICILEILSQKIYA